MGWVTSISTPATGRRVLLNRINRTMLTKHCCPLFYPKPIKRGTVHFLSPYTWTRLPIRETGCRQIAHISPPTSPSYCQGRCTVMACLADWHVPIKIHFHLVFESGTQSSAVSPPLTQLITRAAAFRLHFIGMQSANLYDNLMLFFHYLYTVYYWFSRLTTTSYE